MPITPRRMQFGTPYLNYLTLELRRRFQYRMDFWLNNFFVIFGYLVTSYALWGWIYEQQDVAVLNGYTFHQMMWYYILSAFILQMTRPRFEIVAGDIYSGGLNKYLLYPVSYFGLKFSIQLSYFLMTILQLLLAVLFFYFFIGLPVENFSVMQIFSGGVSVLLALSLYFAISMNLELLGFWFESVWAITYTFQFLAEFFGGRMIPFAFFPDWSLKILSFLPFNFLISFPTRALLGDMNLHEWFYGSLMAILWIAISTVTCNLLWKSGLKQYSGIGL